MTVLFADLAGSTSFEEKVDAETAREVMGSYHNLLRQTAEHHRAGMVKYIGDGFMAVWGVPEISVRDADSAVAAAVEIQEKFVDMAARVAEIHGERLALRVAVNTGEVVVGSSDADLVGDALNVAARLESECPHGHVVVGEETWRSTRGRYRFEPLNPVQVKGRSATVAVYQWAGHRSETADSVPFVGRVHEFRRLSAVLADAISRRGARLVTVIGDPGVGKSRLAGEFARAQQDAVVLQIRCAAEGTVALAPVVETLRTRDLTSDLPSTVPERDRILRDLNGMTGGVGGSVEETFWALRRYFEVLAARGPLILVLDDIHWADTLLLDFVEHLSEWVREAQILMVGLARPELREARPELVTIGGWVGDAIRLGGLEPSATAELASGVLGSGRLPTELLSRLPASTGGNPLFVRELIAMLVHDGVLVAHGDGWRLTIDVDAIAVPPTIQALLASRLERMNNDDRRVLEIASVIGSDFSPVTVSALSGTSEADVKSALDRLRRREFAEPTGSYSGDEPVWRFHHILIRDVAYRRLLKSERAKLHERFADWIQGGGHTGVFESDELVGRHLESAHCYRNELGHRDRHTAELALRSARCYLSAARRALDRDALMSAGEQAARGAALASGDAALKAELLLVGCEAFLSAGDVAGGAALVDELERVADDALEPWATCYRCQYIVYTDPSRLPEVDERLQGAIDEFQSRGDPGGSAKAYRVRAGARGRLGRIGDSEADLFEALIAARQGGDQRQITAALGAAPNAALWGPSPAPKAGGRCLDVVRMQRMTTATPSLEATSLRCLAVLELLRGRPDKARSMLARARDIVSELGLRHGLMETELFAGIIESMVGDPVAAEPHFRTALEGLDSLGVGADAGQAAALLARSLLAQGRIDEADRYAAESERIAGHNLKTAIGWRAARAEILSARGRHRDAVIMAREAVDVAADTDLTLDYADACLTLSRVLADSGDNHGAARARRKAESLYAAKDASFLVESAPESTAVLPERPPASAGSTSRLALANRAVEVFSAAMRGNPLIYSANFGYEDRRKVSGEPIRDSAEFHAAAKRKLDQYPNLEWSVLAVRGDGLALLSMHWRDEAANETASLDVFGVDDSGAVEFLGRFDEDDFASAYAELEARYYAGEGLTFAANGRALAQWVRAISEGNFNSFRRYSASDFRWIAAKSSLKVPERTAEDMIRWWQERDHQVASHRHWIPVIRWLSPNVSVGRAEVLAKGPDGGEYRWNLITVAEVRDGRVAEVREFDTEDEAFAYADSILGPAPNRLAMTNRASQVAVGIRDAMQAGDLGATVAYWAHRISYVDRRTLSGDPIANRADIENALAQILRKYSHFQLHTLAVRGERLNLAWQCWSDDDGNQSASFLVAELGEDDRIIYESRFDEDDFRSAYLDLEQRYYNGEGAPYAESGSALSQLLVAENQGDLDRAMSVLMAPGLRIESRSHSIFPARTTAELRQSLEELGAMVESYRVWSPAVRWLSPEWVLARHEREAVGRSGEEFRWSRLYVSKIQNGLLTSVCEFDVGDEEEAFAYAEACVRADSSRMAVRNRAAATGQRLADAIRSGDIERGATQFAVDCLYEDRRRLSGEPILGTTARRAALERIVEQFSRTQITPIAVRGDHLLLVRVRRSDDSGNESTVLVLGQTGLDDRFHYYVSFDEDDFESAYLEMERRYYSGEGAEFAEAGATATAVMAATNRGDVAKVFDELFAPGLQVDSRSRTVVPSRTVGEFRSSVDEFNAMVSTSRVWFAVVHWLSPNWVIVRQEREAFGSEGEAYEWSRLYVAEIREGAVTALCDFDIEFEDEAFAYAGQLMHASSGRLAVVNQADEVGRRLQTAVEAGDFDAVEELISEDVAFQDWRRWSGDPIAGRAAARAGLERLSGQFTKLEKRTLAVRGRNLVLGEYRWTDESGNESAGLLIDEIGDDGKLIYTARFDSEDFETAYCELERRYYAGEGAAYAEAGSRLTAFVTAINQGGLADAVQVINNPDLRIETRSHAVFPDRSLDELREDLDELMSMTSAVRWWYSAVSWLSPNCCVARQEREAVGRGGERYTWTDIYAGEFRGDAVSWVCRFNIEDEEQAFAVAETRLQAGRSRLAMWNRAGAARYACTAALQCGDIDAAAELYSADFAYSDNRRLSGDIPVGRAGIRAAFTRLRDHYSHFGGRLLAVRGDRLVLGEYLCSDDAGNETSGLSLTEIDEAGLICFEGRFDDHDLDAACDELERRYFGGDGADFAVNGDKQVAFMNAINRMDIAAAREVCLPGFRVVSSPTTLATEERSIDEFFAWLEERSEQVSSVRHWMASTQWPSADCVISRLEIRAVGPDGSEYTWPRIVVGEIRGGRLAEIHQFELKDEETAFAYAQAVVARHSQSGSED